MTDFKLYEVTSYNNVEKTNNETVEERLHLTNNQAILLIQWFYNKDGDQLKYNFNESRHYITVGGDVIWEIVSCLDQILVTNSSVERNMKILQYFPKMNNIMEDYSKRDLFSEEAYIDFKNLHSALKSVVSSNSVSNRERLFLYNIRW